MIFHMSLKDILLMIPAILIALTFHEYCHGLAAYWLGDDTAERQGRLNLNPLAHIDIIGLVCMVLAGVGWAKPVPISPYNFKMKNKKLGMAITALAGPLANFILAFFSLLIAFLLYSVTESTVLLGLADFLYLLAMLSVGLMAFNLLPVPPLDGSKILLPLLPNKIIVKVLKAEKYIQFALMLLLFVGIFDGVIATVRNFFLGVILKTVIVILGLVGL